MPSIEQIKQLLIKLDPDDWDDDGHAQPTAALAKGKASKVAAVLQRSQPTLTQQEEQMEMRFR